MKKPFLFFFSLLTGEKAEIDSLRADSRIASGEHELDVLPTMLSAPFSRVMITHDVTSDDGMLVRFVFFFFFLFSFLFMYLMSSARDISYNDLGRVFSNSKRKPHTKHLGMRLGF